MSGAPIRTELRDGGVLEITLDREPSANAIDLAMARSLAEIAGRCETAAALTAVVLAGMGKRFCAGGNVRSFAAAGAALRELTMHLHAAFASFARMDAPLVTAVNGVTAGAGLGLAAAGDVCIAARSATFHSAYTASGLSPDASSTWRLARLIGMRRAQKLVLTNLTTDAERARLGPRHRGGRRRRAARAGADRRGVVRRDADARARGHAAATPRERERRARRAARSRGPQRRRAGRERGTLAAISAFVERPRR